MTGGRNGLGALFEGAFKTLHLIWLALIVAACALLLPAKGHPPGIVFVPLVLMVGALGHVLLLVIAWLTRRGRNRVDPGPDGPPRMPAELVLIALALGPVALGALAVAVGQLPLLRSQPLVWFGIAAVALVHATAFVLMLRMKAARHLLAALAFGWGLALALQLREARSPIELAIGLALVGALIVLAAYLLRARRIQSALR